MPHPKIDKVLPNKLFPTIHMPKKQKQQEPRTKLFQPTKLPSLCMHATENKNPRSQKTARSKETTKGHQNRRLENQHRTT
ncbi:hypothetical protein Sjap_009534 [Stephania japonica]|uniref:Uncharacterized protein n=1 Tax=Stephania japonica TaxID=461633 RepID=A0AAP0PFK4_9MAGN